jgi:hypothetical protein
MGCVHNKQLNTPWLHYDTQLLIQEQGSYISELKGYSLSPICSSSILLPAGFYSNKQFSISLWIHQSIFHRFLLMMAQIHLKLHLFLLGTSAQFQLYLELCNTFGDQVRSPMLDPHGHWNPMKVFLKLSTVLPQLQLKPFIPVLYSRVTKRLAFFHQSNLFFQICHLWKCLKCTKIVPWPPNLDHRFFYKSITCVLSFMA